ncbi:MAG: hypothetical protein ACI9EF_001590 [Pseudohongiellaceae bacterium]|jgi:hypothetical protein
MSEPRRSRWWAGPSLALAVSVACLGLAEVGVRMIRPGLWDKPVLRDLEGNVRPLADVIGYFRESGVTDDGQVMLTNLQPHMVVRGCYDSPRWDYFDGDGCVEYRMNSLGFRDEEFTLEKPAGELRVLAIGDSFTFGLGVQQPDLWTEVLQRRLESDRGTPVQVINGGFACGHAPPYYAPWLGQKGLTLDPDVVIIGLCLNDMGDIPMMAYYFKEGANLESPLELWNTYQRLSEQRRIRGVVESTVADPHGKRFDFGKVIEKDPAQWEDSVSALQKMQTLTQARGIRLVVAVFPMLSRLDSDYPFAPLHVLAAERFAELGIETLDLAAPFMGRAERELWVHPTDQHPNDMGQAMLGNGIADWFTENP